MPFKVSHRDYNYELVTQFVIGCIPSMPEEGALREICPVCHGGSTRERSFTIVHNSDTREISWKCWRDSCQVGYGSLREGGMPPSLGSVADKSPSVKREFNPDLVPIPCWELLQLHIRYKLFPQHLHDNNISYDNITSRLYIPILKDGNYVGHVLRSLSKDTCAKSLNYFLGGEHPIYVPRIRADKGSTVLVVEDPFSAIKAAQFMPACALLGTNLSQTNAEYLASKYRRMAIALDNDTWAKDLPSSLRIVQKYRLLFDEIIIVPLVRDVKDMKALDLYGTIGCL